MERVVRVAVVGVLLAALALTAMLYHCLNHAIFKSLLFLGTGSVLHATHERSLGKLGGLMRFMPWVAGTTLIGVIASAGLPPSNGFVSEWLTFQAILLSPDVPSWGIKLIVPAVGAMLAVAALIILALVRRSAIALAVLLIATAILFCAGFAVWSLADYLASQQVGMLVLCFVFVAFAAGLAYYLAHLKRFLGR